MNNTSNHLRLLFLYILCLLPMKAHADFLDSVSDKVFEDPSAGKSAGLLDALLEATSWITAIFTFFGVIMLFAAWYELKKKDTGSVVYTLGAVGGLFLTPIIVKTVKAIAMP